MDRSRRDVAAVLAQYEDDLDREVHWGGRLVDVNQASRIDGDRPIHIACIRGSPDDVRLLLEAGADPNAVNDDGWTALHAAIACNSPECVVLLLAFGADPNLPSAWGKTPLESAEAGGSSAVWDLLKRASRQA